MALRQVYHALSETCLAVSVLPLPWQVDQSPEHGREIRATRCCVNRVNRARIPASSRRLHHQSGIVHFDQAGKDRNLIGSNVDKLRPPFDLDLAVVLAVFAFEAYNTPQENAGVVEKDAGDCETIYLALHFLRKGTSDPYVVIRCGNREALVTSSGQREILFGTSSFGSTSKTWDYSICNVGCQHAHRSLKDGKYKLSLKDLLDGKKHQLELVLGGMGGGGASQLEEKEVIASL